MRFGAEERDPDRPQGDPCRGQAAVAADRREIPVSIVAIGTVAYDSIETPFGKVEGMLGGSAMHFAAAASFFSPVLLAAVVGRDFDDKKLDFLKKRGVDLAGLKRGPGKTFHC